MKNFISGISTIKQGSKGMKDINNQDKITNNNSDNSMLDKEVENILLDSKKEEDIIFYHYGKNNLIKLEIGDKNSSNQFAFFEYDMCTEDDNLVLDEKEIENIKAFHLLNVLKPKVELYLSYKNIEFNCTFMRNIYSYAEEIGFENTIGYLLPLLQDLSYQKNKAINLLMAFLDTFEKLLIYFRQYDTDHSIILNKLLPIISQILTTKKEKNLLNKAAKALLFLIDNITMEECLNNVIPILIEMANTEKNEIGQITSIQIFSEKASFLGGEIIELYVLPMFESFSENINDNLREYCIKYMIPLFENINYNIIETKFVKIYKNFSKDRSLLIRRISCNMLPLVCKTILNNKNEYNKDKNIKKEELISNNILNIFFSFTEDSEPEIQINALGIFGEFISYLDNDTIISNQKLINFYLDKINDLFDLVKSLRIDSTPLYKACNSFPSILLTYCKKINDKEKIDSNWTLLKPIYIKFIRSKEYKIKTSIASSFGKISSILDSNIVEKELTPIILDMYKNNGIDIKNIIIKIIPEHIIHIKNKKEKSNILGIYKEGFNRIKLTRKWRYKLNLIFGIQKMAHEFEYEVIFDVFVGMLIQMCFDPYYTIRKESIFVLSYLLIYFLQKIENFNSEKMENDSSLDKDNFDYKECKKKIIIILNNFATCRNYQYRQLFIILCTRIMIDKIIFSNYAFNLLNDLSYDKVVNVRISLGIFIDKIWNNEQEEYGWIKNDKRILEIIFRLKNDKENDVKKSVEKIQINEDVIENKDEALKIIEVNNKFTNEFQEFKKIFNLEVYLGKKWLPKKNSE